MAEIFDQRDQPGGYERDEEFKLVPVGAPLLSQDEPTPEELAAHNALPPTAPPVDPASIPFTRDGRDYYLRPTGDIATVDTGFDALAAYPGFKPAPEALVLAREKEKRSGGVVNRMLTTAENAVAGPAETLAAGVRSIQGAVRSHTGYGTAPGLTDEEVVTATGSKKPIATTAVHGKNLTGGFGYGPEADERREVNPTGAMIGGLIPDVAATAASAFIPGLGPVQKAWAAAMASGALTEGSNAVIEGREYSYEEAMSTGITAAAYEVAGLTALKGLAKAKGLIKNTLDQAIERARRSGVEDALRETDPVAQGAKFRKHAESLYEMHQQSLDDALETIDTHLTEAPDKLFTPSALKKTVSKNAAAQRDAVIDLAVQLTNAAEVGGSPALKDVADLVNGVMHAQGPEMYAALRQARNDLAGAALDSPLAKDAAEALEASLRNDTVWGKAAKHYASLADEALDTVDAATGKVSVQDLKGRPALDARLEQARSMASLSGNEKLSKAVQKAEQALGEADKVTGARVMGGQATAPEIDALRTTLDAFPKRVPELSKTIAAGLDKLDEALDGGLPETWTPERVEGHIAERAAGSAAAREKLDTLLEGAQAGIDRAKASGTPATTVAKAQAQLKVIRAALGEVDDIPKAFKRVRDYDAAPRNATERVIDKVTGKVASKVASKVATHAAGVAAGYVSGGIPGAVVGGAASHFIEPAIEKYTQATANKFGAWLKGALRKNGKGAAGLAALYGANELATDEHDPNPGLAAGVGMLAVPLLLGKGGAAETGLRRLSGHMTERDILKALKPHLAADEAEHLYSLLKDSKVPSHRGGGTSPLYDASHVAVSPEGRLVVFNKQGYAQSTGRYRYQEGIKKKAPSVGPGEQESVLEARRERVEGIVRESAPIGEPSHRGLDTIEVNEKALSALARKTGAAIKKLAPDEQLGLLDYIEGGAASTFRSLERGGTPLPGKEHYAHALAAFESGVEKLQQTGLTEKIGPLWRGLHLSAEDATRLVNSKHVETGSLTSASFKPFYAKDQFADTPDAHAMGHVPVVLKFEHVKRAAPISAAGFSRQYGSHEREALLPSGSTFEVGDVTRKTWKYGGHIEVTLREVPKPSAATVGFVLTGLLGLNEALTDDEHDPEHGQAMAAGVGALALLFGGKNRLGIASKRAMVGLAHELGPVARVANDVLAHSESEISQLAKYIDSGASMNAHGSIANAKDKLLKEIMEHPELAEAAGKAGLKGMDAHDLLARYVGAHVDKRFSEIAAENVTQHMAEKAAGSAKQVPRATELDAETVMGKPLRGQGGSNRGGTYEGTDGVDRYVKLYKNPQQAVGEAMANDVYRQIGIDAPESGVFKHEGGHEGSFDRSYPPGTAFASTMASDKFYSQPFKDISEREAKAFTKGFWADVLLGNWDTVGMQYDNLLWAPRAEKVLRVDNGAALKFRAQGAPKPAQALDSLSEIEGFFNPKINPQYSALLKKAGVTSPKQLAEHLPDTIAGAKRYLENPGDIADPELLELLQKRLGLLEEYAATMAKRPARARALQLGDVVQKEMLPASLGYNDKGFVNNHVLAPIKNAPRRTGAGGRNALREVDKVADAIRESIAGRYGDDPVTANAQKAVSQFAEEQIDMLRKNVEITTDLERPPPVPLMNDNFGSLDAVDKHLETVEKTLPSDQREAIEKFTGNFSDEMKAALRGEDPLEGQTYWAKESLQKALALVPALADAGQTLMYANPTQHGSLLRGLKLDETALHELLTVNRFTPSSILSTSHDPRAASVFAEGDGRKVVLRFNHVEQAAPVFTISESAREFEWLLPQGGAYDVTGRYYDHDREMFFIDLEQAASASKPDITNAGALAVLLGLGAAGAAASYSGDAHAAANDNGDHQAGLDAQAAFHAERKQTAATDLAAAHEQIAAQADAARQAREQQLDETREKLGYLAHQSHTAVQSAARALANPTKSVRTVESVPGVTFSAGVARFLGNNATLREAYDDKRKMLQQLAADPMLLVDELSDGLGELADTAPDLHGKVVAQTYKIAEFLQGKVPATIGPSLVRPEGTPPNTLAIKQFALYYSAATDPSSVLTDLTNNRARKEQVDTLRELWPDTYTKLKVQILHQIAGDVARNRRPTVSQRIRLDLHFDFGEGLDRGLSNRLAAVAQADVKDSEKPAGAPAKMPGRKTQPSVVASNPLPGLYQGAAKVA